MGGFLVITMSHPTFCCVGVGVGVEVGLGCDFNILFESKAYIFQFMLHLYQYLVFWGNIRLF